VLTTSALPAAHSQLPHIPSCPSQTYGKYVLPTGKAVYDHDLKSLQKDTQTFVTRNLSKLTAEGTAASGGASAGARADPDALRRQLCAIHHVTLGQDILVSIQLWQDVSGRIGCRQLCPLAERGGRAMAALAAPAEPVFQFVLGRTYFLAFYVQNRDLASTKRLPFTDVIEVCATKSLHHYYLLCNGMMQQDSPLLDR
jgi:hypothetical protein